MKKLSYLLIGILIGSLIPIQSIFAASPIKLIINGKEINPTVQPQTINDRIMVSARDVAENLGATVGWDAANTAVVINGKDYVPQNINSVTKTNSALSPQLPSVKETTFNSFNAIEANGEIYLSLSDGCSLYDIDANWDNDTKTINFPLFSQSIKLGAIASNSDSFLYNDRTYIKNSFLKNMVDSSSILDGYKNFKNSLNITGVSKPDSYNNINVTVAYNGSKNEWLSIKPETRDYYGKLYCQEIIKNYKGLCVSINFYYNKVYLGHYGSMNDSVTGGFAPYPQNDSNW